jgi:zinc protease
MLSAVLDGHDAARFNKHLVREQKVALSVGIDYDATARGPGMIYLSGSPAEGKTVPELEAALRSEIKRVQKDGVSEQELKRAKAQLLASEVYKLDSMFGQAMEIGQTEAVGLSYKQLDRMLEKLQKVSAAEVQAVAKKYFTDDTLTIGVLEPQALDGKPRRAAVATRH